MSETSTEEGKLRRVYAEIAQLKRDIAFKQGNFRRLAHVSRNGAYSPKLEVSSSATRKMDSIVSSKNLVASKESSSPQKVPQSGFIVDNERRTLMTPNAMKRLHEQVQKRQKQSALLRAQRKAQMEEEEWEGIKQKNVAETDGCDRIKIGGDVFGVKPDGIRLLPITGQKRKEGTIVTWNSWMYLACKSGMLRRTFGEPKRENCRYFTRLGACGRGSHCFFAHEMSHMAICRHFLAGRCDGECLHSHEANEFNTPMCRYHFEDRCSNTDCKFSHVIPPFARDKSVSIWTCRPFSIGGWCDRGHLCPFAHLYNCAEYEETGHCPWGKSCNNTHTMTKRIQRLIADPLGVDDVFVASDVPGEEDKAIVSSYTVNPELLFVRPEEGVKFSIDRTGEEMIIDLSSSDGEDYDDTSSETDMDQAGEEDEDNALISQIKKNPKRGLSLIGAAYTNPQVQA